MAFNRARPFNLFSPLSFCKKVFTRFSVENVLSGVAVETDNVVNTFNKNVCLEKNLNYS